MYGREGLAFDQDGVIIERGGVAFDQDGVIIERDDPPSSGRGWAPGSGRAAAGDQGAGDDEDDPDSEEPSSVRPGASGQEDATNSIVRSHLLGLLEALLFVSPGPMTAAELARIAQADRRLVRELLDELRAFYQHRGLRLDEVAGGYSFRTNPLYGPFVRELTGQRPVKLTRAQIETLAIVAYRQPMTRPEIDDVRGVDSGPMLKVLLERELIRILGKKEEPGRPLLYGTTPFFLEFFGLRGLRDLPTLREFADLTEESRATFERLLGEPPPAATVDPGGLAEGEGHLVEVPGTADDSDLEDAPAPAPPPPPAPLPASAYEDDFDVTTGTPTPTDTPEPPDTTAPDEAAGGAPDEPVVPDDAPAPPAPEPSAPVPDEDEDDEDDEDE